MQDKEDVVNIWQELLKANKNCRELQLKFFLGYMYNRNDSLELDVNGVFELVRKSLSNPLEMLDAVQLIKSCKWQYQIIFIDELINMVVRYYEPQEGGDIARNIIISLPEEWLASNFRASVEHWLQREDAYKFEPLLLGLCADVNPNLAKEFAEEALKSNDEVDHDVGYWILMEYLPKRQHKY
jgi:hypothetical protein